MKLSHTIPAAVAAMVAVLALDGTAVPAQTAPAPAPTAGAGGSAATESHGLNLSLIHI